MPKGFLEKKITVLFGAAATAETQNKMNSGTETGIIPKTNQKSCKQMGVHLLISGIKTWKHAKLRVVRKKYLFFHCCMVHHPLDSLLSIPSLRSGKKKDNALAALV